MNHTDTPLDFFKELVAFAKAQGLTHVKFQGFEFELAPQYLNREDSLSTPAPTYKEAESIPSDEDFLLWSAGGPLPSEIRKVDNG